MPHLFSEKECTSWKKEKMPIKPQGCCPQPLLRHICIQQRRGDEMSTCYRLCMRCSKKVIVKV